MSDRATPGGPTDPVSVTVPAWAVTDWKTATVVALRTVLTFVVVGFLVLLASVLIALIRLGTAGLDLASLLATAFSLPLVYLGGFQDSPVLLTGILVLVFALRRSMKAISLSPAGADRGRLVALAAKVGLVAVALMLVIAIVLDTLDLFPTTGLGGGLGLIQSINIDYVRLVFLTGPVVAVSALIQLARLSNVSSFVPIGRLPGMVRTSWLGLRRTLRISLIGLLVLFALGSVLQTLSVEFGDLTLLADALLSLVLLVVVFVAVDVAALFFVGAMSFLQFQTLGTGSAWEWAGVALVAVAFFLGGRSAAERARPATVAEAVTSASLIGVLLSGIGVLVAIDYQGLANLEGFAAPAILLPLLWTIPALIGAWWYASEQGLPSGVTVSVTAAPTVPSEPSDSAHSVIDRPTGAEQVAHSGSDSGVEPEQLRPAAIADTRRTTAPGPIEDVSSFECPSCGGENSRDYSFCSSCGKPISSSD